MGAEGAGVTRDGTVSRPGRQAGCSAAGRARSSTATDPSRSAGRAPSTAAFEGDTIASALAASGVRVFSRSFKYHRPRGILSASFHDPGCTVQVGDEPNVRGAHRRVGPGHGREVPELVAFAALRHRRGEPGRCPVHRCGLLLQDLHQASAPLALLRAGAAALRRRRARRFELAPSPATTSVTRTPTCSSPAEGRPGWPPPWRPPRPERG